MYENDYEIYMRNVLGYSSSGGNNFPYMAQGNQYGNSFNMGYNNEKSNYEQMYPDIYKILKPMVSKVCNNVRSGEVTEPILDDMVEDIYKNIEHDEYRGGEKNSTMSGKGEKIPQRQSCNNPILKDLIKIMLITEIIKNCNQRPPMPPPYPPRPFC